MRFDTADRLETGDAYCCQYERGPPERSVPMGCFRFTNFLQQVRNKGRWGSMDCGIAAHDGGKPRAHE